MYGKILLYLPYIEKAMKNKISYEEVSTMLELREGELFWILPTRGRRKQGAKAGNINKVSGNLMIEIQGKNYPANHLVWLLSTGSYSEYQIEPINGDKLDNRFDNLRQVIPESTEVTAGLVRRLFDYVDGRLVWKSHLSARSQAKLGSTAGYISRGKSSTYRYIKIGGKKHKSSDLVWLYHTGEKPKYMIDHINHDGCDDRIENLREVTKRENSKNQKLRADNTSGNIGVDKNQGKWRSRIQDKNGRRILIGLYDSKQEAVTARKAAEKVMGYHENHGKTEAELKRNL
jgi:hypothetical protein